MPNRVPPHRTAIPLIWRGIYHVLKMRVLVCWTGIGEKRLPEKLKWITSNYQQLEQTKSTLQVEYLGFCYHPSPISLPKSIRIVYRPGIVFQFMYENLPPATVAKYDYILLLLDDVILHPRFSLSEYIEIYNRNKLDILQCALDTRTHLSHEWMRVQPQNTIGRLANMAEYFSYLMSAKSYQKYYTTFLTPKTFWGWGIDLNLWTVGTLRVGILDKWPLWHRILGSAYKGRNMPRPHVEMARWPDTKYQCLGGLI
jgi:hypothetical protein